MASRANRYLLPLVVFLGGAAALAGAAYLTLSPPAAAPIAIGGPFKLETGDGKTVTNADMAGKPFLVFFGYTHCPDVCPTTLSEITAVFKKLGPDAKIAALFVTVDPQRDTPALMREYASSFDPRIVGLSGSRQAIEAAMRVYHATASKVPGKDGDYTMSHTAIVYLMDKGGRFVNALNLEKPPKAVAEELSAYL